MSDAARPKILQPAVKPREASLASWANLNVATMTLRQKR